MHCKYRSGCGYPAVLPRYTNLPFGISHCSFAFTDDGIRYHPSEQDRCVRHFHLTWTSFFARILKAHDLCSCFTDICLRNGKYISVDIVKTLCNIPCQSPDAASGQYQPEPHLPDTAKYPLPSDTGYVKSPALILSACFAALSLNCVIRFSSPI